MSARQSAEFEHAGNAYGSDPTVHHIVGGAFVCSAPEDAPCRTSPTCECENWCCCCASPPEGHDAGVHCCASTAKPGQDCWIEPWVDVVGVEDSLPDHNALYDEDGNLSFSDGPVWCDWDDGILIGYAKPSTQPDSPRAAGGPQ